MTPICIKRVFILLLNTILIMIMPIIHNQTLANIIHDKKYCRYILRFYICTRMCLENLPVLRYVRGEYLYKEDNEMQQIYKKK